MNKKKLEKIGLRIQLDLLYFLSYLNLYLILWIFLILGKVSNKVEMILMTFLGVILLFYGILLIVTLITYFYKVVKIRIEKKKEI
jgi:hypothetical protein